MCVMFSAFCVKKFYDRKRGQAAAVDQSKPDEKVQENKILSIHKFAIPLQSYPLTYI